MLCITKGEGGVTYSNQVAPEEIRVSLAKREERLGVVVREVMAVMSGLHWISTWMPLTRAGHRPERSAGAFRHTFPQER
jgi:hypothetical protein